MNGCSTRWIENAIELETVQSHIHSMKVYKKENERARMRIWQKSKYSEKKSNKQTSIQIKCHKFKDGIL